MANAAAFFGSFFQYLIIMFILAGVSFLGGYTGKKLRDRKTKKEALESANAGKEK